MNSLFGRRILITGIFFLTTASAIFLFQNCSQNITLESAIVQAAYSPPTFNLKATVCPDARGIAGPASKFVFIIDMSASNIGDWDKSTVLNGKTYSYWDKSKASDPGGDRFKAVANFLDTCSGGANSQFAIIGFSKTAGIITGSGAASSLNCSNVGFTDIATAKNHLANLKNVQDTEAAWFYQWDRSKNKYLTDPNFPPVMGGTSYGEALDCAKNVTVKDITSFASNSTENYHITFISDGTPQDVRNKSPGCNLDSMTPNQKETCYLEKSIDSVRIMRQSALAKGRDLRIHGVFYGPNPSMPLVMDAISKEGGTIEGNYLKDFAADNNALCSLILTQSSIDYQPENLTLINLTVLNKNGVISADSDMDGLTDEEELKMGSDPQDARSMVPGVLDGICQSFGGKKECLERRLRIQCLPEKVVGFALTDCDVKILSLDQIPDQLTLGLDADKDGIPDFVEIIKGTNPTIADMTMDPDGDGLVNRDEIVKGTDVNTAEIINLLYINKIVTKYSPPSEKFCPYGGWSLIADQIQTAKTLENYNVLPQLELLSHNRRQYLMLVLYRLSPTNATSPVSEYYAKIVEVNYSVKNGKEYLENVSEILEPSSFLPIGTVKQ